MEQSITVLKIVLPVILALCLGYFSRQKSIISSEGVSGMKTFVVNFALPAALFRAFASIHYSKEMLISCTIILIACAVAFTLGFLLLKLFPKLPPILPFLITCTEAGMIGFAFYTLLFGVEHLPSIAQAALGCDIFVFTVYSSVLRFRDGNGGAKEVMRGMITSPVFIAIVLGVIIGASGLFAAIMQLGTGLIFGEILALLSSPITFVMLFVVGYSINLSAGSIKKALGACTIRIAVMGSLCAVVLLILSQLITMDRYLIWAIILLFSLPGPYILPVLAKKEEDRNFASTALSLHMLISTGIFCVIAGLAVG